MSGAEALVYMESAKVLGLSYSLILTDIQMPEMTGIEFTSKARQFFVEQLGQKDKDSQPMIVGVSGHVQTIFVNEGIKAGMDMIESKPLYANRLTKILQLAKILPQ